MAGSPEAGRSTNLAFAGLVLLATISYGVNVNLVKGFFSTRNSVLVTSIALSTVGWPSLVFLLAGTNFIERLHTIPAAPSALAYIAILGAFGTALSVLLFNQLLKDATIIFATSVTYTIPIVAVLWGIALHEQFTTLHAAAFAVILPVCGSPIAAPSPLAAGSAAPSGGRRRHSDRSYRTLTRRALIDGAPPQAALSGTHVRCHHERVSTCSE